MHEPRNVGSPRRVELVDAEGPERSRAGSDREAHLSVTDADEAAANEARVRGRTHGPEPLEPDEGIRRLLAADEQVLAARTDVALYRPRASLEDSVVDPLMGVLYVTSARLVHMGPPVFAFDLDDIVDASPAGDRVLLLLLRDGVGITLEADRPKLLRVQVAGARAARASASGRRRPPGQAASR